MPNVQGISLMDVPVLASLVYPTCPGGIAMKYLPQMGTLTTALVSIVLRSRPQYLYHRSPLTPSHTALEAGKDGEESQSSSKENVSQLMLAHIDSVYGMCVSYGHA